MSSVTVTGEQVRLRSEREKAFYAWLGKLPAYLIVLGLVLLWTIPTLGLFVSSFRPAFAIQTSGWWTALFEAFDADWTLAN